MPPVKFREVFGIKNGKGMERKFLRRRKGNNKGYFYYLFGIKRGKGIIKKIILCIIVYKRVGEEGDKKGS